MKMQMGQASFFRYMGGIACGIACMAVLLFALAPGGVAQAAAQSAAAGPQSVAAAQPAAAGQPVAAAPGNTAPAADSQSAPAAQTPKQKQLADDTAKLLQLANELKAELDKSSKDMLSLNVMKKAEQVEKLAHKVRDEMRASLAD
jgi:hypothetical protein